MGFDRYLYYLLFEIKRLTGELFSPVLFDETESKDETEIISTISTTGAVVVFKGTLGIFSS